MEEALNRIRCNFRAPVKQMAKLMRAARKEFDLWESSKTCPGQGVLDMVRNDAKLKITFRMNLKSS